MSKEGKLVDNKFGFASFILGLFSLLFFWALFVPSIIMGIVSIIFAIIQLRKGKSKYAIAGLVLSLISLVLIIILVVKVVALFGGIYACQVDPESTECTEYLSAMGIDTNIMKCLSNSSAPGCSELLGSFGGTQ